jgi:hypothetical protein
MTGLKLTSAFHFRFTNDASEKFDREDSLSLIRPRPIVSKNGWSVASSTDAKAAKDMDAVTPSFDEDDEENKRE